jgi:hypothetical protein
VTRLLSVLAEAIVRRALAAACASLRAPAPELAVVAMGKLGGREFTYHSDLDLIFLHGGGVEAVATASRLAQRLISYVTTRTGAGFAYAVDAPAAARHPGHACHLLRRLRGLPDLRRGRPGSIWPWCAARPIAGRGGRRRRVSRRDRASAGRGALARRRRHAPATAERAGREARHRAS